MTGRMRFGSLADKAAIEAMPLDQRQKARTVFERLSMTAESYADRPAISFQIRSGPKDRAETLSWAALYARVVRAANLFRELGIGQDDVVAYLLPNCNEAAITLLAGCTAGIVTPVNPLLDPEQIAAILREANARVLVTLAAFPKSDVAQRAHAALAEAPCVETVLEVDLGRYLPPPLGWVVPFLRPKLTRAARVRTLDFNAEVDRRDGERLSFQETGGAERIGAYFHTGGTTGMPKLARHAQGGMVYNGLCPSMTIIGHEDVLLCPLPLFHVFAAYPILMSCVSSGAHMVMPTPAGYRGQGVMGNFWKLVERWGVTFMVMVPTAAAALMQRKVEADVSTLKYALCGSAPLPVELFRRFEAATGVKILEGYGMTEATCLISINPPHGERKIGSVGLPFPYTRVKILHVDEQGRDHKGMRHGRGRRDLRQQPRRLPRLQGREARPGDLRWAWERIRQVAAHRRSRPDRRRRLCLDHRPGQGPDHPRRPQHRPGADRGGAGGPSGRRIRRRDRPARRPCRRGLRRLCRAAVRRQRDRRRSAGLCRAAHPRARGHPEACRGADRAAEDRGRQGLQARSAQAGDRARLWQGAGRRRHSGRGRGRR